jgi:hypothetical protein
MSSRSISARTFCDSDVLGAAGLFAAHDIARSPSFQSGQDYPLFEAP